MSNRFKYDIYPDISRNSRLINLVVLLFVAVVFLYLFYKHNKIIIHLSVVSICAMIIISTIYMVDCHKQSVEAFDRYQKYSNSEIQILPLSKTGKNVVVIMLDRAISLYFPYLLKEKPELKEQFSGFTYYPNTISFGGFTNTGTPALFGGYEYTPEQLNKRDDELLVDKQNEALRVLPVIFDENNFDTVVCDPPYAGYSHTPDLSIYDDHPDIKAYITKGMFQEKEENELEILNRNLLCYSITQIVPNVFFDLLYDEGHYLNININNRERSELISQNFIDWIEVLSNLNNMTYQTEEKGSFIMIKNAATHELMYLQPDYTYSVYDYDEKAYDNVEYKKKSIYGDQITINNTGEDQIAHYQVNMASMIQLGKWFDYLRENDLYDNTRIIIVSDHGRNLGLNDDLITDDDDYMMYNALLLYKDFNSNELSKDDSFMTNADVAYLATKDIINNPKNPFTGKEIIEEVKKGKEYHVFGTDNWDILTNNDTTFAKDKWYSVHDNCLDSDCWSKIADPNSQ